MDIGVGAFIVSSAIVSAPARQARPSASTKRYGVHILTKDCEPSRTDLLILPSLHCQSRSHAEHNPAQSFPKKCYAFLRPIALVLVFGIARFLTVKGVNYQVELCFEGNARAAY
jgi:hypothetical protein